MTRYRRRDDILWRRSLDRVLALRPGDHEVTVVGGGGVAVWSLLTRATSIAELIATLEGAHDEVPETLGSDVRAMLDDLVERGLVEAGE